MLQSDSLDTTGRLLQQALIFGLMPLWLLSGFADWLCHRVQRIEHSSGVVEARLHLLMLFELGSAVAAAALLEIDAGVLALLLAACVAHEATLWWDLVYSARLRRIPVVEQWVHWVQFASPWVGLAALMLLHPEQAGALFGSDDATPDWEWRLKQPPLPLPLLGALTLAGTLLIVLPFVEEWWRCRRVALHAALAVPAGG